MIVATHIILERLERMTDDQLGEIINETWEPFDDPATKWPSLMAPDRETFKALLRALTDDYVHQFDVDTAEHIREANSP